MDRLFIVVLAVVMLAVWLLCYLLPPTTYPYSLEHIQFGYDMAMRYLGFPF